MIIAMIVMKIWELNMSFNQLQYFLLFLGKGRSGSSLCGGLIACHPNAIIAHEKEIKNYKFDNEDDLYNLLIEAYNSKLSTWKPLRSKSEWREVKRYDDIRVIGTKKQGTGLRTYWATVLRSR